MRADQRISCQALLRRAARPILAGLAAIAAGTLIPVLPLTEAQAAIPIIATIVLAAWFGGGFAGLFAPSLFLAAVHLRYARWQQALAFTQKEITDVAVLSIFGAVIGFSSSWRRRVLARLRTQSNLLSRQAEILQDADAQKDRFLAILSHELRNPLAPLLTSVELLRNQAASSDRDPLTNEFLDVIERQVQQMTRLIQDLSDVSRIRAGKVSLHREPVDLKDVAREAIEAAKPHLESARQEFSCEMPDSPLLIHGDRTRMIQAVLNLLNNATKFTPRGGRVSVQLTASDSEAVIRVRDSGIGIAPDVTPKVFDLFVQAETSTGHSQGGLGIGLGLVRAFVEMHGGSVSVQSEGLNQGSEFQIRLPRLVTAATTRHAKEVPLRLP